MKVVIAVDSFKGSLTSQEAGQAIQESILQTFPEWETDIIPIADGGEGTLNILLKATGGEIITKQAHDPLMKRTPATYGISIDKSTAFIEMANISGLPLVPTELQNPMKTTTYGTGELIRDALERGCTKLIIGIGGSATNDAGAGMLQALGYRFLDINGNPLGVGGKILGKIASIDSTQKHSLLKKAHFIVACDVNNPFFGPKGAAHVFARQKGADDSMIVQLDQGMRSFAQIIHKETGKDISDIPGSGAAGGMGGTILAFFDAEIKPGADLLLDICQFDKKIANADLIITGEGRIDRQSLMGKIPGKILQKGIANFIPVIAIAGCVADRELLTQAGFKGIYAAKPENMPLEESTKRDIAIQNLKKSTIAAISELQ